jgi:NitT/TauT family transport system substrate-binding protein
MFGGKRILHGTLGILLGLGLALGGSASPVFADDPAQMLLDWIPYGKHAPFYVGVDKGIYKQYSLDVKVLAGKGSGLSIKTVGAKGVEFASADAGSLVLARANEPSIRTKLIAMLHHNGLFNIVALAKSGINSPKDLAGKKIGSPVVNASRIVFPAFAELAGLDPSKVVWVDMDAPVQHPSLFSEQVDAIATYVTQLAPLQQMAKKFGKPIKSFAYADYGLDVYSNGLIAHEDTIKNRAPFTRRFVIATLEALKWSVENPDEAVQLFLRHYPTSDPEAARGQFDVSVDVLLTKETKETGIGFMLPAKIQRTIDLMARFEKEMKRKPSPGEIFTNEFVAIFPTRPTM